MDAICEDREKIVNEFRLVDPLKLNETGTVSSLLATRRHREKKANIHVFLIQQFGLKMTDYEVI